MMAVADFRRFGISMIPRAFTTGILLAPVGLLLHPPFVAGVIVPFLAALGVLV